MNTPKITWKQINMKFGSPVKCAYLGQIIVASVQYNISKSRTDIDKDYVYSLLLPGLKSRNVVVATEALAIQMVETLIHYWFKSIGE